MEKELDRYAHAEWPTASSAGSTRTSHQCLPYARTKRRAPPSRSARGVRARCARGGPGVEELPSHADLGRLPERTVDPNCAPEQLSRCTLFKPPASKNVLATPPLTHRKPSLGTHSLTFLYNTGCTTVHSHLLSPVCRAHATTDRPPPLQLPQLP